MKRACPDCATYGWYTEPDPESGEPRQAQCARCEGSGYLGVSEAPARCGKCGALSTEQCLEPEHCPRALSPEAERELADRITAGRLANVRARRAVGKLTGDYNDKLEALATLSYWYVEDVSRLLRLLVASPTTIRRQGARGWRG